MSSYFSDSGLDDIVDASGATIDVAFSPVERNVRLSVDEPNGAEAQVFLTPEQARRVAASVRANADSVDREAREPRP